MDHAGMGSIQREKKEGTDGACVEGRTAWIEEQENPVGLVNPG